MTISIYLDIVMSMEPVIYFKALADETRLRLLNLVLHHELNVNEVVEILQMGQSRISRHLKILTDSKLLTFRRDGLWTFYSASEDGDGHHFLSSIRYLLDKDPVFQQDLTRARRVVDERSKESTQFFDAIAEDWEKLKMDIIGGFDLNEFIINHIPGVSTIVDFGCGTGDLLPYLKHKADYVIGVDRSENMLGEARSRFREVEHHINLRIGDIRHLPLRDNEADLGIINMVLHHLQSPQSAMQEIYRVLKPGSQFIIVDFLRHQLEDLRKRYGDRWLGFSEDEIGKWLEKAGFDVSGIEYFKLNKGLKGFILSAEKPKKNNA